LSGSFVDTEEGEDVLFDGLVSGFGVGWAIEDSGIWSPRGGGIGLDDSGYG
jgi:hypothetical protein